MKLYALRSKSLNYLNQPFVANDDTEVLIQLRDAIQKNSDSSLVTNISDIEVVILANFDPTEGLSVPTRQIQNNMDTSTLVPVALDYDLTRFLPLKVVTPDAGSQTV